MATKDIRDMELLSPRYIRSKSAVELVNRSEEDAITLVYAAHAVYKLPRTFLIHKGKLEDYMKHLYKVPNTGKYVKKQFVRIGEGSMIYSIGHHRFIEMARAAGAVYKVGKLALMIDSDTMELLSIFESCSGVEKAEIVGYTKAVHRGYLLKDQ